MRFDEFALRVAGDEFRIRFHDQLTVLAGVGPDERTALVASIVGSLTGAVDGAQLLATDHTGRPVALQVVAGEVQARFTDEAGGTAPAPIGWFAPDAASLRSLLVVTADDLGADAGRAGDVAEPPALASARSELWQLDQERQAAVDARAAVEASLRRMGELDEALRSAESDATDRQLLEAAPELHRLAGAWVDAADAADAARADAEHDDPIEAGDVDWLAAVPEDAPDRLARLLHDAAEADRQVHELRDALRDVATAALPDPDDEDVVTLAAADQTKLWDAHQRLTDARIDLDKERVRVGGIGGGATSALVEAMEDAHRRWEAADTVVQDRQVTVVGGGALLAILALPAAAASGPLLAAAILLLVVGGVAALLGQPVVLRARAARDEKAALAPLGVATYLTFHMRRIDATLDPTGRDRLELAEAELRLAERAWGTVARGVDHAAAGAMVDRVRSFAGELGSRHGAIEELARLRRVLEDEREPAARSARAALVAAVAPYGLAEGDVDGVGPDVVEAVVAARIVLGAAARRYRVVLDAEAEEQRTAGHLDVLLHQVGYDDGGPLPARFEAAGWAIERATDRASARAAADTADPAAVQAERDALSASLAEHERAGAELERLSARRVELAAEVARLEAEHLDEDAGVSVERVRTALLAHLARVSTLGPHREPLPVLLDDALARIPAESKWELMDMLRRLGEKAQVLYLTDDAFIGAWARRRAEVEDSIVLLEPVE